MKRRLTQILAPTGLTGVGRTEQFPNVRVDDAVTDVTVEALSAAVEYQGRAARDHILIAGFGVELQCRMGGAGFEVLV